MRVLPTIVAAVVIAVVSASVLPWVPLLRWSAPVAIAMLVLIVWPSRPLTLIALVTVISLLADAITGYPIGPRTLMLLATGTLCWPMIRSYMRQRRFGLLLITAAALSFAEALATSSAAGGFPPTRWMSLFRALWPAVVLGVATAYALHWCHTRPHTSYGTTRS